MRQAYSGTLKVRVSPVLAEVVRYAAAQEGVAVSEYVRTSLRQIP